MPDGYPCARVAAINAPGEAVLRKLYGILVDALRHHRDFDCFVVSDEEMAALDAMVDHDGFPIRWKSPRGRVNGSAQWWAFGKPVETLTGAVERCRRRAGRRVVDLALEEPTGRQRRYAA